MVKCVGRPGVNKLALEKPYISNLSLLLSLEPFEKFVVGDGWSKVILVLSLRLKLNKNLPSFYGRCPAGRGRHNVKKNIAVASLISMT